MFQFDCRYCYNCGPRTAGQGGHGVSRRRLRPRSYTRPSVSSRHASSDSRAALSHGSPSRAFHRLRPELREILSLAATGLSSLEIAASLSLPRPTVATRLRLARRLFARALTRSRRWPR
ncbi:sigma factor-like helix-turn-helix DNA-binding protein [Sorangium sp. So ce1389]|uniref:sigma factor-like helix-turn-helix DNA-binding protein n=1 Tax=Sorangium sp. So ce1389 TaxID=3133336 RepID=UPI003F63CE85